MVEQQPVRRSYHRFHSLNDESAKIHHPKTLICKYYAIIIVVIVGCNAATRKLGFIVILAIDHGLLID